MAKKHRFYFNPHDLTYVIHNPKVWEKYIKIGGFAASMLLIAVLMYAVHSYKVQTPGEVRKDREINFYKHQLAEMNQKLEGINSSLKDVVSRNNQISVILEGDTLASSILEAGTGGVNNYSTLEGYDEA